MRFPGAYASLVQRLRVPAGFVLLACFLWLAAPSHVSLGQGVPVSALGLALRAWAAGHLAKDQRLATTGPYAHVRNPLYLGTLFTAVGLAIAARHLALPVLLAAVFLLVYFPAIKREEEHLAKLFQGFAAYAERVPLLVPRLTPAFSGPGFSWTLYLRNEEYKALLGWFVAVGWLSYRAAGG